MVSEHRESVAFRRVRLALACVALMGVFLAPATSAWAEDKARGGTFGAYDPTVAGHPVRVAYYLAYPVGLILDTLILRPAWWLGQRQPFRTIFGVEAAKSNL